MNWKQRCLYLEIVVRFNRDIPTLVTSSRVPEVQTQLDTTSWFLHTRASTPSCRSVTTCRSAVRFEQLLSVEIRRSARPNPLKKSHRELSSNRPSSGWVFSSVRPFSCPPFENIYFFFFMIEFFIANLFLFIDYATIIHGWKRSLDIFL